MSNESANPASIDWAARSAKRRNDDFLDLCLSPLLYGPREEFNCLCLPASQWIWEGHMAERWRKKRFVFEGVEAVEEIRDEAEAAIPARTSLHKNAQFRLREQRTFQAALQAAEAPYDIIYADYMGAWSFDKLFDITTISERRLLKPMGCLIMTLSLTRNSSPLIPEVMEYARGDFEMAIIDDREHYRELGMTPPSGVTDMSRGIPRMIADEARHQGAPMKLIMGHIYYNAYLHQGSTRLAPEISMCFRRQS